MSFSLLDAIFPKFCFGCRRGGVYICAKCLSQVSRKVQTCPGCLKPSVDGKTHFKCQRPYGLDGHICVWRYEGVVRSAIIGLKYKFASSVSFELAVLLFKEISACPVGLLPKKLVPIPLHSSRERWRGFNQSLALAQNLCAISNFTIEDRLLIKTSHTQVQANLSREERAINTKGAFEINPGWIGQVPEGVVIIDDVWTTGSTIKEAAKVLKRGGVKVVWGLTIAG